MTRGSNNGSRRRAAKQAARNTGINVRLLRGAPALVNAPQVHVHDFVILLQESKRGHNSEVVGSLCEDCGMMLTPRGSVAMPERPSKSVFGIASPPARSLAYRRLRAAAEHYLAARVEQIRAEKAWSEQQDKEWAEHEGITVNG